MSGYVWVAGGKAEDYKRELYRYSPSEDKWYEMTQMSYLRDQFQLVAASGMLVAVGGFGRHADDDQNYRLTSVEMYDEEEDVWRELPPMNKPREAFGIAVYSDYT